MPLLPGTAMFMAEVMLYFAIVQYIITGYLQFCYKGATSHLQNMALHTRENEPGDRS